MTTRELGKIAQLPKELEQVLHESTFALFELNYDQVLNRYPRMSTDQIAIVASVLTLAHEFSALRAEMQRHHHED